MKKILVIPHSWDPHVLVRLTEVAASLSRYYQVFLLKWDEPAHPGMASKVGLSFRDFLKEPSFDRSKPVIEAQIPFLHRPLSLLPWYNSRSLARLIRNEGIGAVVNGLHYFFFTPPQEKTPFRHIFDLNDLPAHTTHAHAADFISLHAAHEAKKAHSITACSPSLARYCKERFGRDATFIPNGTRLREYTGSTGAAAAVRERYHLQGKYVIGYIGKIGDWIDMKFLLAFFREARCIRKDAALLLVGDMGPTQRSAAEKEPGVICTGGVGPGEATAYFQAIDMGVLPSRKTPFQQMAFHVKLIEYTAAKKQVIATDLDEVTRLGFGNIERVPLSIEAWRNAFRLLLERTWNPAWDSLVKRYDWDEIAGQFRELIEQP